VPGLLVAYDRTWSATRPRCHRPVALEIMRRLPIQRATVGKRPMRPDCQQPEPTPRSLSTLARDSSRNDADPGRDPYHPAGRPHRGDAADLTGATWCGVLVGGPLPAAHRRRRSRGPDGDRGRPCRVLPAPGPRAASGTPVRAHLWSAANGRSAIPAW